jgi:hypothetical protein
MKRNDHIYIWIILGTIVGFIYFLSSKELERKEKDISGKNKACLPGTYVSTFFEEQNKQYIVCRINGQYWNNYHYVREY